MDAFDAAQGGEPISLGSLALSADRNGIYRARGAEVRTADFR